MGGAEDFPISIRSTALYSYNPNAESGLQANKGNESRKMNPSHFAYTAKQ